MPRHTEDANNSGGSRRRKQMKQLQLFASNYIPGIHPGMENLIRWADGERLPGVERHLARCARCRHHAQLLRSATASANQALAGSESAAAPHVKRVFENLQLQMKTWCSLRALSESRVGEPRQAPRIAGALAFYFGKEAARRIEHSARWDDGDACLIPATKPLFSAFLGKKAADALAHKLAGAAS